MLDIFQGSIGKAILLKDKQEEYEKLQEMIDCLNTKDLIPVNVTTTSAEYLNYTNNGKHFTNYAVEVEASQKNFRK